jgi:hypothetical protein
MPDQNPSPVGRTDTPEVVNISHADVEAVTAEMVRLHQSAVQTINSEDVEMNIAAVAGVRTRTLSARQSLIGDINADSAQINKSVVGGVRGTTVDVEGMVGGVAGDTVNLQNARVGVTVAKEVRGDKVESLILLAGRVEGEVHTAVDTRGAIIAGLVGGLFAGLLLLVGRIAFRRDED